MLNGLRMPIKVTDEMPTTALPSGPSPHSVNQGKAMSQIKKLGQAKAHEALKKAMVGVPRKPMPSKPSVTPEIATKRAAHAADAAVAATMASAETISEQAMQAHLAGYENVAKQLNTIASQLSNSAKLHAQQAGQLQQIATFVGAGKPELCPMAGITSPVPAQNVIAGVSPMLLRAAGAGYCYYLAQTFMFEDDDPQKMLKTLGLTAVGAYSPVFGSMATLLLLNFRKGRRDS